MYKVMKTFVCRGCDRGHTIVDIGVNANVELVDKVCYLGDMLVVDGDADEAVETQNLIWYHCLPISIYH